MDNGVKGVLVKDTFHVISVPDVRLIVGNRMAEDLLHPAYSLRARVDIIIDNNSLMPRLEEFDAGMGADETGGAGKQNLHFFLSLSDFRKTPGADSAGLYSAAG